MNAQKRDVDCVVTTHNARFLFKEMALVGIEALDLTYDEDGQKQAQWLEENQIG